MQYWRIVLIAGFLSPSIFGIPGVAAGDELVRVTGDDVNIRLEPTTDSAVVVKAAQGDIFEAPGKEGSWYQVLIASGEYRYLHESLVEPAEAAPPLPTSIEARKQACYALVRVENQAMAEADRRFPNDIYRNIDYQRLLIDRNSLPVLRKHDISPARRTEHAFECAKNLWLRP